MKYFIYVSILWTKGRNSLLGESLQKKRFYRAIKREIADPLMNGFEVWDAMRQYMFGLEPFVCGSRVDVSK